MRTIIVTGGLGFIGSHFIKELLAATTETQVINVDNMTYAAVGGARFAAWPEHSFNLALDAQMARLGDRHLWLGVNVARERPLDELFRKYEPAAVVHFAAESHVDRSIDNSSVFLDTNLMGTHKLLEACVRAREGIKFVYVSTDEVYGPYTPQGLGMGFTENDLLNPRNPYSATKAGAEHLAMAYHHTYGLNVLITRGCNTYGPYQHPEKFLPLFILNAMEEKPLPLYGDGRQVREWLHVRDHVEAILYVLDHGAWGEVYNISSGERHTNLDVAHAICHKMGQSAELVQHVADRPGHDRMYAVVPARLEGLWKPRAPWFLSGDPLAPSGLSETIRWYTSREGQDWCAQAGQAARDRLGTRTQEEVKDEG